MIEIIIIYLLCTTLLLPDIVAFLLVLGLVLGVDLSSTGSLGQSFALLVISGLEDRLALLLLQDNALLLGVVLHLNLCAQVAFLRYKDINLILHDFTSFLKEK